MNKTLRSHEDGLNRALKDTMPGLAPSNANESSQTIINSVTDERPLGGQRHRLLIRPDAFHVTILFQPTLAFLHRITEILPSDIQAIQVSSSVLDEFVVKVYLPQLEEKVLDIFHHAVTGSQSSFQLKSSLTLLNKGPDAFLPDSLSRQLAAEPIVKVSFLCIYLLLQLSIPYARRA